jgi:hypothetical protein
MHLDSRLTIDIDLASCRKIGAAAARSYPGRVGIVSTQRPSDMMRPTIRSGVMRDEAGHNGEKHGHFVMESWCGLKSEKK